jgi:hypothetical protein
MITRHMVYTPALHAALSVSANGHSYEQIAARVAARELAVYECNGAVAVVSYTDGEICIEAVEGPGGLQLVRIITDAGRRMGQPVSGWVYDLPRVRMVRPLGFRATGETRECENGVIQRKVAA